jgi:hypothetical protein
MDSNRRFAPLISAVSMALAAAGSAAVSAGDAIGDVAVPISMMRRARNHSRPSKKQNLTPFMNWDRERLMAHRYRLKDAPPAQQYHRQQRPKPHTVQLSAINRPKKLTLRLTRSEQRDLFPGGQTIHTIKAVRSR